MATVATVKDIKETDKIVTESICARRGNGTYTERMEDILLTYSNIYRDGMDCVIRLTNGSYQSVWNYVS